MRTRLSQIQIRIRRGSTIADLERNSHIVDAKVRLDVEGECHAFRELRLGSPADNSHGFGALGKYRGCPSDDSDHQRAEDGKYEQFRFASFQIFERGQQDQKISSSVRLIRTSR